MSQLVDLSLLRPNPYQSKVRATGYDQFSLSSLNTGEYGSIHPVMFDLMDRFAPEKTSISLSSMHASTITPELAEQIFDLPVRRGKPADIGGLTDVVNSPIYATGVGLVKYGSRNLQTRNFVIGQENLFDRVTRRMKEWFGEFF